MSVDHAERRELGAVLATCLLVLDTGFPFLNDIDQGRRCDAGMYIEESKS